MKEINLAAVIVAKRREKGITQDELAEYIGVSKASVSKWETGQSYPDITFLPQLAAYFNISIDQLMGYSPQMIKEDIKKLYHRLSAAFAVDPYDELWTECRAIIKKYYSCFPLLVQIAKLYLNHCMLAKTPGEQKEMIREAAALCERVKAESGDVQLSKEAALIQAACYLGLQEAQSVLDLLGETIPPILPEATLISRAYQLLGNTGKAKEILQVGLYQDLLSALNTMLGYLHLNADQPDKAEEVFRRALALVQLYNIEKLNPNIVVLLYASGAQMYCLNGNAARAIELLDQYVEICIHGFFPFTLRGDSFFDSIDGWLSELDLGAEAPRSEKVIKDSMMRDILLNPVFAPLQDEPNYLKVVQKLKNFIGGH